MMDLFISYFLSMEFVSGLDLSFPNQTNYDLAVLYNDVSLYDLACYCMLTWEKNIWLGSNLFFVIGIGLWTIIPVPKQLGSCWCILLRYCLALFVAWDGLSTSLSYIWHCYTIFSVIGIGFQTLIPDILIFHTMTDPVTTLLGIVHWIFWGDQGFFEFI